MTNVVAESPAPDHVVDEVAENAAAEARRFSNSTDMLLHRLRDDGGEAAAESLLKQTVRGYTRRRSVVKGLNQEFLDQFGHIKTALTSVNPLDELNQMFGKSFTAGNLGSGSAYGVVPFDLLAPSRLIYPVYTVFRNRFPRIPAQGTSLQERAITGISGSQTASPGIQDISMPELVVAGAKFSSWPTSLPATGSQEDVHLNVPYKFFGITEAMSWLSQFAGQGFEDISALANLILLQEMMLGEEYQLIAGTSAPLAVPSAPTCTIRNIGPTETALPVGTYSVYVAAANYWGSTAVSSPVSGLVVAAGQAIDVTISPVLGALNYNIWANNGVSDFLAAPSVGAVRYTLKGPLPAADTRPATDTGTGKNTRMEGVIPVCAGASANAGVYPAGWTGGYTNQIAGTRLDYNLIYTTLDGLWNFPKAHKADPEVLVGDGGDIARLSQDVISQGNAVNYRLYVHRSDMPVTVGVAVSEFQSPITRSNMKVQVHPWFPQGTALLMSHTLPHTWSEVTSAWEMHMVQEYVSLAWPTIDTTFSYSIFFYGTMVAHAPQYTGLIQGIQVTETPPYS